MVGDVIDGRVILHESPVFKDEEFSSDYSIVITLPEIIDGEYVDPTYNKNEFRVVPKGTKYSTHRVIYDIGKSYLVDPKDYSDFWDAQRDYKIRYFRAAGPSSPNDEEAQSVSPEIEGNFKSRRRNTLIGAIIGVAILFYFLRFTGYF